MATIHDWVRGRGVGGVLSMNGYADVPRICLPLPMLTLLQAVDGSFELSEALAAALGAPSLAALQAAQEAPAVAAIILAAAVPASRAWATALVLVALETTFASMRESWSLFAKRSSQWLRRALGGAAGVTRVSELQAAALAALKP